MAGSQNLSVLFVASECFPLIKTGGLADVVGALPLALEALGVDVTVLLPGFPAVLSGMQGKKTLAKIKDVAGNVIEEMELENLKELNYVVRLKRNKTMGAFADDLEKLPDMRDLRLKFGKENVRL